MDKKELEVVALGDELARNRKSVGTAYLLWLLLGWCGVHKFYLGMTIDGLLYVLLVIAALPTMGLSFILTSLMLLIDAFALPGFVSKSNEKRSKKILAKYE